MDEPPDDSAAPDEVPRLDYATPAAHGPDDRHPMTGLAALLGATLLVTMVASGVSGDHARLGILTKVAFTSAAVVISALVLRVTSHRRSGCAGAAIAYLFILAVMVLTMWSWN